MKIAFIDRDGVIINEPQDTFQIDSLDKLQFLPNAIKTMKRLIDEDYKLVMVSNQNGIGTPSFPTEDFEIPQNELLRLLKEECITFYKVFVCPHFAKDNCNCRKPKTGLVDDFLKNTEIDYAKSFMIGDRETDMQFAENIGVRGFKKDTNSPFNRLASVQRTTTETDIFCQVNLDGEGKYQISTGLNFFDHMLEQIAKNSLVDITINTKGDLQIDEHHTVEDTALVLGETIAKALDDFKAIERYGFTLPMDEALAEVAIDLGGRPNLVFNTEFNREYVGDLPTELVKHFFKSLSDNLKATIHINLKAGENEHHKIEAIFKAFGRALRAAIEQNQKYKITSTKGLI